MFGYTSKQIKDNQRFLEGKGTLFIFFLLFILTAGLARAQDSDSKLQISLLTGYQQDNLHWSIAGNNNGQNPNIFSELKWKGVGGTLAGASIKWNAWGRLSILGSYNRSFTSSGKVNDMDYIGDNRTQPVYAENFSADKGYTDNWFTGLGYQLIANKTFSLMPGLGYGINRQSLYLVDHSGQFPGLNSTYAAKWKGPYVCVNSTLKITSKFKAALAFTYSQVKYNAVGGWNLINEFQHPVSYVHSANGYNFDANAKLVYAINPNVAVNLGGGYFNRQTGNGTDQLYLSSGEVDKTQLNGVVSNGIRIIAGVDLFF